MGVFRKSLSLSATLSLILGTIPITSFAEEKISPMGFNKGHLEFCRDAPGMMTKLNAVNGPKLEKINGIREEIESLNKEMQILNTMGAVKYNYEQGLQGLKDAQSPESFEEMKKNKFKNLDNMKKVIRNGLILDAVGLLLKNGELDKKDAFSIDSVCEAKNNKDQIVCKKEDKFPLFSNTGKTQEEKGLRTAWLNIHPLDKTLENFKEAYSNVKAQNKDKLKEDIKNILNSIPSTISPAAIFSILDSTAPGITELLASDMSKENLTKCLDPKTDDKTLEACEKLLPDIDKKESFLTKMTDRTKDAIAGLKDLHTVIDEASKKNIASLGQVVEKFKIESQLPSVVAQSKMGQAMHDTISDFDKKSKNFASDTDQKNRKPASILGQSAQDASLQFTQRKQLTDVAELGVAQLFLPAPKSESVGSASEFDDLSQTTIDEAKRLAAEWQKKCTAPTDADITFCRSQLPIIESKIGKKKELFKNRLIYLQDKVKELQSNDDGFTNIETMKKYVAEKYLRTCLDNPEVKIESLDASFGISVDNVCYHAEQTLTTLNVLSANVDEAIAKSKYALAIKKGTNGPTIFNKEDMTKFSNACGSDAAKNFGNICDSIFTDQSVTQEKIQKIEDEKPVNEDKDFWVTSNGHGGFNKVAKKSTLRIIGEGALPVLPQMIPMLFANYQMGSNISMLTDQGIYQKQMLHTYDVYNSSPWMYNYNYFGGSVFPGYGSPFATTTGTTTGTATSTAGFGF